MRRRVAAVFLIVCSFATPSTGFAEDALLSTVLHRGTVRGAEAEPIGEGAVIAIDARHPHRSPLASAALTEEGTFELRLPAGPVRFLAVTEVGAPTFSPLVVPGTATEVETRWRLERGVPVAGTIRDSGGRPIEGAQVSWRSGERDAATPWPAEVPVRSSATGGDGRFELAPLPSQKGHLVVTHPEHLPTVVTLGELDGEARERPPVVATLRAARWCVGELPAAWDESTVSAFVRETGWRVDAPLPNGRRTVRSGPLDPHSTGLTIDLPRLGTIELVWPAGVGGALLGVLPARAAESQESRPTIRTAATERVGSDEASTALLSE